MSDYLRIFKNLNIEGEYSRTSHYLEQCGSKSTTSSTCYELENSGEEMEKGQGGRGYSVTSNIHYGRNGKRRKASSQKKMLQTIIDVNVSRSCCGKVSQRYNWVRM